jgi:hypothetical protein
MNLTLGEPRLALSAESSSLGIDGLYLAFPTKALFVVGAAPILTFCLLEKSI